MQSFKSHSKITICRPTWKRTIVIKTWANTIDMALMLITSPAKEKGQAFLKRDKNLWNWQPSISRTIKIAASASHQAWMGSDFTVDDVLKCVSFLNDFKHISLGKEQAGGEKCHKILLTPKANSTVIWGKIILWIGMRDFVERKIEYYDENGKLIKTCRMSNVRTFNKHNVPMLMEMTPANKKGHKTVIEIAEYAPVASMNESFFSLQNLKRLR